MNTVAQYIKKYRKAYHFTYRPKEYYPLNKEEECDVSVALCSIANMNLLQFSFGSDILDKYLKKDKKCFSDRAVLWDSAMLSTLGVNKALYSNKPVRDFDLVLLSAYMRLQVFNVVPFLLQCKMHPLKEKRKQIVVLGGNVALQYPVLYPYVDLFYFGDGEVHLQTMIDIRRKTKSKEEFLEAVYSHEELKKCVTRGEDKLIIPAVNPNISEAILGGDDFISKPTNKVVEIARGCKYDCNFCFLGAYKHPYRTNDIDTIREAVCKFKKKPTSIYPFAPDEASYRWKDELNEVVTSAGHRLYSYNKRFNTFDPAIDLQENKSTSRLVFGLDGISQRMREFGNKRITIEQIHNGLRSAIQHPSVSLIKLNLVFSYIYETEKDWDEFIDLLRWFCEERKKYRSGHQKITWKALGEALDQGRKLKEVFGDDLLMTNVAATPFVPEPGTVFEFMGCEYNESLKMAFSDRLEVLKKEYAFIKNEGLNGVDSWMMDVVVNRSVREDREAYEKAFHYQGFKPFSYSRCGTMLKIFKYHGMDVAGKKKEISASVRPNIKYRQPEEKRYAKFLEAKNKMLETDAGYEAQKDDLSDRNIPDDEITTT